MLEGFRWNSGRMYGVSPLMSILHSPYSVDNRVEFTNFQNTCSFFFPQTDRQRIEDRQDTL